GALVGITVGGLFFTLRGWRIWVLMTASVIFSVIITAGLGAFLGPVGLPPVTLPYTIATWIAMLCADSIPRVIPVPLDKSTIPEDHIQRFLLSKSVTKLAP